MTVQFKQPRNVTVKGFVKLKLDVVIMPSHVT